MEIRFCYIHRSNRPVPDLRILVCRSSADLERQLAALKEDYPLARIEIIPDDRLGDPPGLASSSGAAC